MNQASTKIYGSAIVLAILSCIIYWSVFSTLHVYSNAATAKYKFPDSKHYEGASKAFYTKDFTLSASRPLGFPILIGIPYLFNASPEAHVNFKYLLQFIFWISSVLILFALLTTHLNYLLSSFLALLYALNIGNIIITNQSLTEPIFCFLLILSAYSFNKYLSTKSHTYLLITFFAICYSAICKPVMEYFAYLLFAYLIFSLIKHKAPKLKYILGATLIFALTIGLQKSLMKIQHGSFQISKIGKAALYTYIGAKAKSFEKEISVHEEMKLRRAKKKKFRGAKLDSLAMSDFKDQLSNNTSNLLKAYFLNIHENSTTGSTFVKRLKNINKDKTFFPKRNKAYYLSTKQNQAYSFLTIIGIPLLILIGLFFPNVRTKQTYHLVCFMWLMSIYIIIFSGLSYGQKDRFHIVFVPCVIAATTLLVQLYIQHFQKTNSLSAPQSLGPQTLKNSTEEIEEETQSSNDQNS